MKQAHEEDKRKWSFEQGTQCVQCRHSNVLSSDLAAAAVPHIKQATQSTSKPKPQQHAHNAAANLVHCTCCILTQLLGHLNQWQQDIVQVQLFTCFAERL
jgi:hypothetical protein